MRTLSRNFKHVFLLIACIFWMSCDGDDNIVNDNVVNVSNTNFFAEESFSSGLRVTTHTRLRLKGINSNAAITGRSGSDSVIITGVKRVRSESTADAQAHLQQLQVNVQDLTSEVFAQTVQPQQSGGRIYEVDYDIAVPESLEVTVGNVNGSVRIDSVNNTVSVDNENGSVNVNEIIGSTIVRLENGPIVAKVTLPLNGTINMDNTNGGIDLEIPVNTSANFSANVTNGAITVSNLVLQNPVSSSTSLSGTLGAGQGTISLTVVNGNIGVSGL